MFLINKNGCLETEWFCLNLTMRLSWMVSFLESRYISSRREITNQRKKLYRCWRKLLIKHCISKRKTRKYKKKWKKTNKKKKSIYRQRKNLIDVFGLWDSSDKPLTLWTKCSKLSWAKCIKSKSFNYMKK